MKALRNFFALAALAFACSASAQPYMAIGLGSSDGAFGTLSGGWQITKNIGLEAGAVWMDEHDGYRALGVLTVPLSEKLFGIARVGVYHLERNTYAMTAAGGSVSGPNYAGKQKSTDIGYGFGAEWAFSKNVGLRGVYDRIELDYGESLNALSVEVLLRF